MRALVRPHPRGMARPQLAGCAAQGRAFGQPGAVQATLGRVGTLPSGRGRLLVQQRVAQRVPAGARPGARGVAAGRRAGSRGAPGAAGPWPPGCGATPRRWPPSAAGVTPMAGGCGRVMVTTGHANSTHGGAAVTAWTVPWSAPAPGRAAVASSTGTDCAPRWSWCQCRAGRGLAEVAAARGAAVDHGLGAGRHRGHGGLGGQRGRVVPSTSARRPGAAHQPSRPSAMASAWP